MQFNSKIEITEILKLRVALYENTMVYWIKKNRFIHEEKMERFKVVPSGLKANFYFLFTNWSSLQDFYKQNNSIGASVW